MRSLRPLESFAALGPAAYSRRQRRAATSAGVARMFVAALVPLSAIDSPVAMVLCALSFALLGGWIKALASPSGRALFRLHDAGAQR